jgi:hypothetical protein
MGGYNGSIGRWLYVVHREGLKQAMFQPGRGSIFDDKGGVYPLKWFDK